MTALRKPREPGTLRVDPWGNGGIPFGRRGDAIATLIRKADPDLTTSCDSLAWRTLRGSWDSTLARFRSPQHLAEMLNWQGYQAPPLAVTYFPVRCGQCDTCKAKAKAAASVAEDPRA